MELSVFSAAEWGVNMSQEYFVNEAAAVSEYFTNGKKRRNFKKSNELIVNSYIQTMREYTNEEVYIDCCEYVKNVCYANAALRYYNIDAGIYCVNFSIIVKYADTLGCGRSVTKHCSTLFYNEFEEDVIFKFSAPCVTAHKYNDATMLNVRGYCELMACRPCGNIET